VTMPVAFSPSLAQTFHVSPYFPKSAISLQAMKHNKRLKRLREEEPAVTTEQVWAAGRRGDPTLRMDTVSTKKLLTPNMKRARLAYARERIKDSDFTLMLNVQIDESEVPLTVTKKRAMRWKGQQLVAEDKRAGRPVGGLAKPIKYILAVNPLVGNAGYYILPDYSLQRHKWQVRKNYSRHLSVFFFSQGTLSSNPNSL
jgi:hypothetical protein